MPEKNRYWQLDFARGFAVILMLIFHLFFDASYVGKIELEGLFFYLFPRFIGAMFVFISGFTMSYAFKNELHLLKRALKLATIAFSITTMTYILIPEKYVVFGIIHFFALSSLLVFPFIRKENLCIFFGMSFTLFGFYIQQFRFPINHFFWLGIVPEDFNTLDYYPLLPWFGILLLGIYTGKKVRLRKSQYRGGFVSFLGRHSLKIYLLQHPIIILLLHLYYGDILSRFIKM
ncbi:MAG: heparan-alpha-glucosaminide N-acetyltransferase [Archaeoglobaceae archaeon]|nr:DUF1624 domain-containing protein [Archaeoglobaceae archaeon]MDW7989386.1 heparan-alpha-glucosaminide N-acetyltransferase [Archaeoglobaceae archaeon]